MSKHTEERTARAVALAALHRIENGEHAGNALATELADGLLSSRDRAFVTELVQGTTRMQRSCDHLIKPFLKTDIDAAVRSTLRLGTYQLAYLGTPRHAAVSETVDIATNKVRGLVNAVLRKVADLVASKPGWPSRAVELSYPDWLMRKAIADWGEEGDAMLAAMNDPERTQARLDGYVQGLASEWVVDEVDALRPSAGGVVLDLCAAPGGKTTGLSDSWQLRIGAELDGRRVGLLASVAERHGHHIPVVRSDAAFPPFRPQSADAVLVDAPCSGLGALGRRSDARWRISADDVLRLASLQRKLIRSAAEVVRPGGVLVYSVCTFTLSETTGVADKFTEEHPEFEPVELTGEHWRSLGTGGIVLPQDHGTDAMAVFAWRRVAGAHLEEPVVEDVVVEDVVVEDVVVEDVVVEDVVVEDVVVEDVADDEEPEQLSLI
jgi:16S rRNA (cytosine967-C5)-methyltransferase